MGLKLSVINGVFVASVCVHTNALELPIRGLERHDHAYSEGGYWEPGTS
jgi:hypothetical protein